MRDLRAALADHGQDGWIDSRELRGGTPLWSEIQQAIEGASAFAAVVSPYGLQSEWLGKELRHALEVQRARGRDEYPVIPLSLDGTRLGVLTQLFEEEPLYIPASSGPGGVEAAMDAILVGLGERLPADVPTSPQPVAEPLEDLVLELTDLRFVEKDGLRRASARARLVYEPATLGQPRVHSEQRWRLVAPIGPIEAEELRWYLEKYAVWPSHYFRDRARKVVESLAEWGRLLHRTAMPMDHTAYVLQAWSRIDDYAGRRFSVRVDAALEAGASDEEVAAAKEAATLLLGLPWELLHDGKGYLFHGARPTRVRRRLPSTEAREVPVVATPIRILLVTARPEDDSCSYIDHRISALPLVEAMESLPGLVELHVLSPPTLPALTEELGRARRLGQPYHVVHFDGHGVYDPRVGLGGLCFEHPEDAGRLEKRRHVTVYTEERPEAAAGLGALLRDHRIPLVFLEACQTAQAERASESVASELLKVGVASVVAMSHSVLVETARRFVAAFYRALAGGRRVGDAMLEGQRALEGDKARGRVFGTDELRLHDWFVPVLYQEKDDPQLFKIVPARQTVEDARAALAERLGDLPAEPETGFIGRSRELLALQRLLRKGEGAASPGGKPAAHLTRYAVIRGQGGEGKTALAAELARWMVRSQQVRRAAFVSVEGLEKNIAESVLDSLGGQLVHEGFSTQADCGGETDQAEREIERVLREQPTLLVMDNMESVLLPQFLAEETPRAVSEAAEEELVALLELCKRLVEVGDTWLVFTSRESLPAPFEARRQRLELHRLAREDAVRLIERVLDAEGRPPSQESAYDARSRSDSHLLDERQEAIERLVRSVSGHARTLALLAPALRSQGVEVTRRSLVELMAEMEERFPGSRERSVFASVELSLRRMSEANRERARVLGVFYGGVHLDMLRQMMEWDESEVSSLAIELVGTGLATPSPYNHLTLNAALCPYLRARLDPSEQEALTSRWIAAMLGYVGFLHHDVYQNVELASALALLELPNLFALLDLVERSGDSEATVGLATSLHSLLQWLGKPRLLDRVGQARDAAAEVLGDAWSHARFEAARTRIEQQLASGRLSEALDGTQRLLEEAQEAGEQAYYGADYDLAMAINLRGQAFDAAGGAAQALPFFEDAETAFEAIANGRSLKVAEMMASVCAGRQGNCLMQLGRLDEAAAAYEERVRRAEQLADDRGTAVGRAQLGAVRLRQNRHGEALAAYAEARKRFANLNEPGTVATTWHQTGLIYQQAGQPEAAEDAYRRALAIMVRLGDVGGQAATLGQLGNLLDGLLNRPEESVVFYRQAADKYVEMGSTAREGITRSNLGSSLHKLGRLDEARREIRRAIECGSPFGHASEPWKTWAILAEVETAGGNPAAAAEAKRRAITSYLAYRRDGGENQSGLGRLVHDTSEKLVGDGPEVAVSFLQDLAADAANSGLLPFIWALQAIVAGGRDSSLAEAPELTYSMAAEILLLIETLEQHER